MSWFFGNTKSEAQTAQFWELLQAGEIPAALEYFEKQLSKHSTAVPKPLRAAYYLYQWLGERDAEVLNKLCQLAHGEDEDSALGEAAELAKRLQWQHNLAQALTRRSNRDIVSPASPEGAKSKALERLALAVLDAIGSGIDPNDIAARRTMAERVLRMLPAASSLEEGSAKQAYNRLVLWAGAILEKYEKLWGMRASLAKYPPEQRAHILSAILYHWGLEAVAQGDVEGALSVLGESARLKSPSLRSDLILLWGIKALERKNGTAAAWFQVHFQEQPDDNILTALFAIACLQEGLFAKGRVVLARLIKALDGSDDESSPDELSNAYYLTILSMLSETREWASPAAVPNAETAGREVAVKNRALWSSLRKRIDPVVARLKQLPANHSWKGHLLAGLIAHVESGVSMDAKDLALFSASIERVTSSTARTSLKRIEGNLRSKVKATEEAVALIRQHDYQRLRELKEAVLDSLGEAIPPLVRASVYMTLWRAKGDYDPLPELQALQVRPAQENLILECIRQVQISNALKQLAEECLSLTSSDRVLPSLSLIKEFDPGIARDAALASALVHIRQQQYDTAREILPTPTSVSEFDLAYLHFYLAWLQGNLKECRRLSKALAKNPWMERYADWLSALHARLLLEAVAAGKEDSIRHRFLELGGGKLDAPNLPVSLVYLVLWLIQRQQTADAYTLVQLVLRGSASPAAKASQLHWTAVLMNVFTSASLRQFNACIDAAQELLRMPVPSHSVFGAEANTRRMLNWVRVVRLIAELGLTASASDPALRILAIQRLLPTEQEALKDQAEVQPYLHLMTGLLASLSPDVLIDEAIVQRLRTAQQTFSLKDRAGFIERILGQLSWRTKIMDDFWGALKLADYKTCKRIYHEELLPALGERLPPSIRLGVVLADWHTGAASKDTLVAQLKKLRADVPQLSQDLLERMYAYLDDADKVRHMVQLIETHNFEKLGEIAESATWTGYDEGAMPVPVALALLLAHFKREQHDEAERLARGLADSKLSESSTNTSLLLLGLVLFKKKDFPGATEIFAKITTPQHVGHDLDRYWAVAQFSHGLQLLAVDQKHKAFDAFSLSLQKRDATADNSKLAPLFIHFGLKNIEARNGNRARHSFELMSQSLETAPDSPDVQLHRLLARMGETLCSALMSEDLQDFGGEAFRDLHAEVGEQGPLPMKVDGKEFVINPHLERVFLILAICQDLRRQARLSAGQRQRPADLHRELTQHVAILESLHGQLQMNDPVLLTLKGASTLLWKPEQADEAMTWIEDSLKLGIQSNKLIQLLAKQKDLLKKQREQKKGVLDLFDAYLASGSIPTDVKHSMVQRNALSMLYQLNRNYLPEDFITNGNVTEVAAFCKRLEQLLAYVAQDNDIERDGDLRALTGRIKGQLDELKKTHQEIEDAESKIMDILAAKIRAQSLDQTTGEKVRA